MTSSAVFLWTTVIIISVISIIFYILSCLGLMKIADKNGVKHSCLAWIPFLNFFIVGKIAFKSTFSAIILFILSFFYFYYFFASAIFISVGPSFESTFSNEIYSTIRINISTNLFSIFLGILPIIFIVMYLIALYRIYKIMSTKAIMMFIFSILTSGLLTPIFLFAIRNNSPRTNQLKLNITN